MRISKKQSQAREGKNQITGSNRMGEYFNNKHGSKEKHTSAQMTNETDQTSSDPDRDRHFLSFQILVQRATLSS